MTRPPANPARPRLLFTGGGGVGTEALFRLLEPKYEVHAADADRDAIDPIFPADRRHSIPWASDPKFAAEAGALCARLGIDLLVPGVDEELLSLAKGDATLAPTRVMQPSATYTETMLDKLSMIRALEAKGLPVPSSRTLADALDGMTFPCIAKPRHGRGSRGVRTLATRADAEALRTDLGPGAVEMLLQQKAEGVEFTVQMIADASARLRAIVPVRIGVKRGVTIRARTDDDPQVVAACQAIHEAIPAASCYNIQLMLTPDGRTLPFEINPRVSTTFCMSIAGGIDPIAIFLGRIPGEGLIDFTVGLTLRRNWVNHFSTTD